MKQLKLAHAIWISSLLACTASHAALKITPERCAIDSLAQWNHDLDPAHYPVTADATGTARGRNAWLNVCDFHTYKTIYPDYRVAGLTAEFDKLSAPGHNTRFYPTFGIVTGEDANNQPIFNNVTQDPKDHTKNITWVAPTVAPTSSGADECNLPANFDFVGICASGCVTPEQQIMTEVGAEAISDLESEAAPTVAVPSFADGKISSEFKAMGVKSFLKDGMPAQQKILVFTTDSGASVKVSMSHPLLSGEYKMVPASQFAVGQFLVRSNGEKDRIASIQQLDYMGKLHNLYVDTASMEESMYVVQGFISGDKRYQDIGVSDLNRQAMRKLVRE